MFLFIFHPIASLVQCTHYSMLQSLFSNFCGFAVPIVMGPVNSGKTTAAQLAMASLALGKSAFYKRIVPRKVAQVSATSRMPFVIDDAGAVDEEFTEIIVALYNRGTEATCRTRYELNTAPANVNKIEKILRDKR